MGSNRTTINVALPYGTTLYALQTALQRNPGLGLDALYLGPMGEESTAVLVIDAPWEVVAEIAHQLCRRFSQACVAALHEPTGMAALIGPRAHTWGVFDSAKFITSRSGVYVHTN